MSQFEVKVVRIAGVEPIENADAIEVAVVGDYRSIIRKGQYKAGDYAVYIPEDAIVPLHLIQAMGLEGKLAGKNKDRVKAIKLRGVLSQGLLLSPDQLATEVAGSKHDEGQEWSEVLFEGHNVADILGITKYAPIIPPSMAGDCYYAGRHLTVNFDVENYKKYPNVIADGEEVVMTEKLHGTFFGMGILPDSEHDPKHMFGKYVLFSKGLGAQGLCFKLSPKSEATVYLKAAEKFGLFDALQTMKDLLDEEHPDKGFDRPLFILGEVFGGGVQDSGWYSDDITYRLFDVASGFNSPGLQTFFNFDQMVSFANVLGIPTVPVLYRGPFSKAVMLDHTSGMETVSGDVRNMREGTVVKPLVERTDPTIGRVLLKSVSEAYILRKGGSEFN